MKLSEALTLAEIGTCRVQSRVHIGKLLKRCGNLVRQTQLGIAANGWKLVLNQKGLYEEKSGQLFDAIAYEIDDLVEKYDLDHEELEKLVRRLK